MKYNTPLTKQADSEMRKKVHAVALAAALVFSIIAIAFAGWRMFGTRRKTPDPVPVPATQPPPLQTIVVMDMSPGTPTPRPTRAPTPPPRITYEDPQGYFTVAIPAYKERIQQSDESRSKYTLVYSTNLSVIFIANGRHEPWDVQRSMNEKYQGFVQGRAGSQLAALTVGKPVQIAVQNATGYEMTLHSQTGAVSRQAMHLFVLAGDQTSVSVVVQCVGEDDKALYQQLIRSIRSSLAIAPRVVPTATPDRWMDALSQIQIQGVMARGGTRYAMINGVLYAQGSRLRVRTGTNEYSFSLESVGAGQDDVVLTPRYDITQ